MRFSRWCHFPRRGAWFLVFSAAVYLSWSGFAQGAPQANLQQSLQKAHEAEEKMNYAEAERIYRQALTVAPNDLETLMQLGVLYQKELKFSESLLLFQRVLKADAQFPEANLFAGISFLAQNNAASAVESFERELMTPRPHLQSHYYLALALQASGRNGEAIAQMERAFQDNPKDIDALYQLVRLHKAAAIGEMQQAAQSDSQEAARLIELARQHGDATRQAMDRLQKADPDSYQWHALMGEVYADQERYPEALTEFRAALAKRPGALGLHFRIGATLWTQSQYDGAAEEFQKALREDTRNPKTNLYLAAIAVRQQRYQDALKYLAIVRTTLPNHPVVHLMSGKCYLELRNLGKAKYELLTTIQINPNDTGAHYLLARVYRELGDKSGNAHELEVFEQLMKAEKDQKLMKDDQEKQLTGEPQE